MGIYFPDGKGGKHFVGTESSYSLQAASSTEKGGVIVTGNDGLKMDGETLKADIKEIPTAAETVKGGVMVGENLYMQGDSLNASIPPASSSVLGGVRIDSVPSGCLDFYQLNGKEYLKLAFWSPFRAAPEINLNADALTGYSLAGRFLANGNASAGSNAGVIQLMGAGYGKGGRIYLGGGAKSNYGAIDPGGLIDFGTDLEGQTAAPGKIKGKVIFTDEVTFQGGATGLEEYIDTVSSSSIPLASSSQNGLMSKSDKAKLDGIANNANNYTYDLPTASTTSKGGIKVGTGLAMNGDTLNCTVVAGTNYTLPTASASTKGGVKVGKGLTMDGETLKPALGVGLSVSSADNIYLKRASDTEKGGVIVTGNDGLIMDGETLKANISSATTVKAGLMSASDKTKLDSFQAASQYVTVVSGKGLSTNDYTTAEKNKLAAISVSGGNVVIDTSNLVTKESGKGLSTNDYTNADKSKLNSLASITTAGENITINGGTIKAADTKYTLPTASTSTKGGVKVTGTDGLIMDGETLKPALGVGLSVSSSNNIYLKRATDTEKGGVIITGNDGLVMDGETLKTDISNATTVKSGLMSAGDKTKLDSFKAASQYVTIVSGKGLSTEDFTTTAKNKLDNLASITTAGENITINGGTISAANTTYTAGNNVTISNGVISAAGISTVSSATVYIPTAAFDSIMANFTS